MRDRDIMAVEHFNHILTINSGSSSTGYCGLDSNHPIVLPCQQQDR